MDYACYSELDAGAKDKEVLYVPQIPRAEHGGGGWQGRHGRKNGSAQQLDQRGAALHQKRIRKA